MDRDCEKKTIANHLQSIIKANEAIGDIARENIPNFHFLTHKVSYFWNCEKSPIGWCVWNLDESKGSTHDTICRYCGRPDVRK